MLKRFSPLIIIVLLIGALVIVQLGRPGTEAPPANQIYREFKLVTLNDIGLRIEKLLDEAVEYSVQAEKKLNGSPEEFEEATELFDKAYTKFKEAYEELKNVMKSCSASTGEMPPEFERFKWHDTYEALKKMFDELDSIKEEK